MSTFASFTRSLLSTFVLTSSGCDPSGDEVTVSERVEVAAEAAPEIAPSGRYAVTATVVESDCGPDVSAVAPWEETVLLAAEAGWVKVNVRLPAVGRASAWARQDLRLDAHEELRRRIAPIAECWQYEVETTTSGRLVEGGLVVARTVAYGDASSCGAKAPSRCVARTEYRYTLLEAECPAECTRGARPVSGERPGSIELAVDCSC